MEEIKMKVKAMKADEMIKEINKFRHTEVKKVSTCLIDRNEIEVTCLVKGINKESRTLLLKELHEFLGKHTTDQYGYEGMSVTPAKFKKITSYDEANMMFASDIPIENKRAFIEILNCRNIGSMYYKEELIDVVELTLIANYEKVLIQSLPVSLDNSLVEQLYEIDIIVKGTKCSELIGKRFIGKVQSILKDNESRYVVTDVEPLPEDYCLGGLILEMDTI